MTATMNTGLSENIARRAQMTLDYSIAQKTKAIESITANGATWSNLTALAEADATIHIYSRIALIAGNRAGDWATALEKTRESYTEQLLTIGPEQSTNIYARALSATQHAAIRQFLNDTARWVD